MSEERILPRGSLRGRLRVPGSKSLTNRALVAAAFAPGRSEIRRPLVSDDTMVLASALERLGATVVRGDEVWTVTGPLQPISGAEPVLDVGPAGTPARFLAAVAATLAGPVVLDGSPRMRERPMAPLLDALRSLGASVTCLGAEGRLPVRIEGGRLRGGRVSIRADVSSQFVSALMLIAPLVPGGLEIDLAGQPVSGSYLDLTREILSVFAPGGGPYAAACYEVAGDDSAACFPIAGAVLSGGVVEIEGLARSSAQADAVFRSWASAAGGRLSWRAGGGGEVLVVDGLSGRASGAAGLAPLEVDVDPAPDAALPLAALLAFSRGTSRLRGLARLREKESDRLAAAVDLLERAGARARLEGTDDPVLIVDGADGRPRAATFDAHDDHRVAMSAAVLALVLPEPSRLSGAGSVSKSYPRFFDDWERLIAPAEGRR